jgi:Zn-finger nucleic acid-binding protein
MTAALRCPGLACGGRMTSETRFGVTVDRCERCGGLWFDVEELDRWLGHAGARDVAPPESRVPSRGVGSRPCPLCDCVMNTAGWTDLVLDRCGRCGGLFVEAREFTRMEKDGLPAEAATFESRLTAAMADAGWGLYGTPELVLLILRLLRLLA